MSVYDTVTTVTAVLSVALLIWWIAGRWIGGEKLILISLCGSVAIWVLAVAISGQGVASKIAAIFVAGLAIYGAWRLRHFIREYLHG